MGKEVFNYENNVISDHDILYYGFHRKKGKISIDTKRLNKVFKYYNQDIKDYFSYDDFITYPRSSHYFVPLKKHRYDFFVNYLIDSLRGLLSDWKNEFEPMIKSIKTPAQTESDAIVDKISYTANQDDYDEIFEFASLKRAFRESKYDELIRSFCVQYIQKVNAEFMRVLFFVLSKNGWQSSDDIGGPKDVVDYVQERFINLRRKKNPIFHLKNYKYFLLSNNLSNFTKHNSLKGYIQLYNNPYESEEIKNFLRNFVYEGKDKKYQNGDYAIGWVKVNPDTVVEIIEGLMDFSYDFCELVFDESPYDSTWNYDDYLLRGIHRFIKENIDCDWDYF